MSACQPDVFLPGKFSTPEQPLHGPSVFRFIAFGVPFRWKADAELAPGGEILMWHFHGTGTRSTGDQRVIIISVGWSYEKYFYRRVCLFASQNGIDAAEIFADVCLYRLFLLTGIGNVGMHALLVICNAVAVM